MTADVERTIETHGVSSGANERLAVSLVAAAAAFSLAAFAPQLLNDGDTYLHIAAGARMLAEHAILYRDPFSYTFAGASWEAHEWLAEVTMAAAFHAGGWSGLVLFFAVPAAATVGLLAHHLGRWLAWPAQALGVVLAFSCMTASLLARPHLLALPLLEIWTAELILARSERRAPSPWLLPVMAIWVNIHGSFLLGLGLTAALALEACLTERARSANLRAWGWFGTGAVLAALLNPHFIHGVLFPLALLGTASLANVGEWRPVDFSRPQPLEFVILATIYFTVTRGVRIPAPRAVIVLVLLHMALLHQRHQILFAVMAPLLVAEPLALNFANGGWRSGRTRILVPGLSIAAILLVAALATSRLLLPVTRSDSPVGPMTALQHVPLSLRQQPVLNDYSFGGFLIFSGVRPFIDSRAELYGDDFLRRYARIIRPDASAVQAAIRANNIRWTILSTTSPVVSVMDSLVGWHRLYSDDFAVVHIQGKYAGKRD